MLLDFATEYADVPFSREPLCKLDLLVFVQLACLDFPATCKGLPLPRALAFAHTATVHAEADEHDSSNIPSTCALLNKEDAVLARIVSTSTRYNGVFVRSFESAHDPRECQQFAALSLECADAVIIVFRGTDATFSGWKETLNMAVNSPVPSQERAALFLERIARSANTPKPLVLCGHSKGGNLAVYAGATCADDIEVRIASIVSFDGPGLSRPLAQTPGYQRIQNRITLYVPRASIVGLLFAPPTWAKRAQFIGSRMPSVMQHYPYFWKTRGAQLAPSTQSPDARIIANGVQNLIDKLTASQKTQLIETVFRILEASGARTFYELDGNFLRTAAETVRAFTRNGSETRRLAAAIAKTFAKGALDPGKKPPC